MSGPSKNDVFDLRWLKKLCELMNEHDLGEVDLGQEGARIRVRRGADRVVQVAEARPAASAPAAPVSPAAKEAPAAEPAKKRLEIKSEMVGTFYAAPSPDSPPYVRLNDFVAPEKVVCQIEAMKVFNEIPAGVSGRVVEICVENGQPVEFEQVLFRLDPG